MKRNQAHPDPPNAAPVSTPRRVHVLLLPEVNLLDLAGPVQVFDVAGMFGAPYELAYCAEATGVVSAQGLPLGPLKPPPHVGADDLVVVPGPRMVISDGPLVTPSVRAWLREAYDQGAQVASVCSGSLALGEAGLLDGRRCTSHWVHIEPMRERYPKAKVVDDVLYTHDDRVTTSAGIASGIDMALSLLEREHGPLLTAKVARYLVVYLRRDAAHSQASVYLDYRTHQHPRVHRAQDYLVERFTRKVTLAELARVARLSERGLSKAFKAHAGVTPMEYQQQLRLELAAQLMHDPSLTLEDIARRCGFGESRHLRRVWSARFGSPPSASRQPAE